MAFLGLSRDLLACLSGTVRSLERVSLDVSLFLSQCPARCLECWENSANVGEKAKQGQDQNTEHCQEDSPSRESNLQAAGSHHRKAGRLQALMSRFLFMECQGLDPYTALRPWGHLMPYRAGKL